MLRAAPDSTEGVKWGQPVYSKKKNACHLSAEGAHAKLGFWAGTSLRDPEGLLQGTGKSMRHVKVRGLEDVEAEAFTALILQAFAVDEAEA